MFSFKSGLTFAKQVELATDLYENAHDYEAAWVADSARNLIDQIDVPIYYAHGRLVSVTYVDFLMFLEEKIYANLCYDDFTIPKLIAELCGDLQDLQSTRKNVNDEIIRMLGAHPSSNLQDALAGVAEEMLAKYSESGFPTSIQEYEFDAID